MGLYDGPKACSVTEFDSTVELMNNVLLKWRNIEGEISEISPTVYNYDNLENMRIITHGEKIVSHVALKYSKFQYANRDWNFAMIGGVSTHPEYRNQGLASKLLKDAIQKMKADGIQLCILWSRSPDYYRRLGWEHNGFEENITVTECANVGTQYSINAFRGEFAQLHELRKLSTWIKVFRSFEDSLRLFSRKTLNIVVARSGKEIVAYAAYLCKKEAVDVVESGGNVDAILQLLQYAKYKEGAKLLHVHGCHGDQRVERLIQLNWTYTSIERSLGMFQTIRECNNADELVMQLFPERLERI